MRLIDADKIRDKLMQKEINPATIFINEVLIGLLDDAPTVVSVVRCGECKHRYVDGENVRYNICELNHNKVQSDDWFCADAERKSE